MRSLETRPKLIFALAVAALVAGAVATAALHTGETGSPSAEASRREEAEKSSASEGGDQMVASDTAEATAIAEGFLDAYLRYQAGELGDGGRETLVRLSTPQFRDQLLSSPVRFPAGEKPAREWVSRVLDIHVGIFSAEPALLVSVVVTGVEGTHVLIPTLVKADSRWLVAGIGV